MNNSIEEVIPGKIYRTKVESTTRNKRGETTKWLYLVACDATNPYLWKSFWRGCSISCPLNKICSGEEMNNFCCEFNKIIFNKFGVNLEIYPVYKNVVQNYHKICQEQK